MNVFLAGIIQGSIVEERIHQQDWREPIKQALARHVPEANVYCHYERHPSSITYGMSEIRTAFSDGVRRANESDLVVAYLPSASMGTAIEMHEAWHHGAAVLTISPLAANWVVRLYSDRVFPDVESFEAFLASSEFAALMQAKRNI